MVRSFPPSPVLGSRPSTRRSRPGRAALAARARAAGIAAMLLAVAGAARAETAPGAVRADVPDRRWTAVGAADAALAGAGLATDPASSGYANPALSLLGPRGLAISGFVLNPSRDDLRASTVDYRDANGFVGMGEVRVRARVRGLGLSAYFAQPHYEHGESRFIGFNPATGGGGDPYPRRNEFTSATRVAGAGAAMRLASGAVVGAAVEGVFLKERYESVPVEPAVPAETLSVDRSASTVGGAVGVAVPIAGLWTVGASFHAAGQASDGPYADDPPRYALVGVKLGRTAGSQAYAGFRWLGRREVDLGDGAGVRVAPARSEYAAGYAYLDPAGTWSFRLGGALSPRPDDASIRLTRFGAGLGVGSEGLRGGVSYARESENRPAGRNSSRNVVAVTVELTN